MAFLLRRVPIEAARPFLLLPATTHNPARRKTTSSAQPGSSRLVEPAKPAAPSGGHPQANSSTEGSALAQWDTVAVMEWLRETDGVQPGTAMRLAAAAIDGRQLEAWADAWRETGADPPLASLGVTSPSQRHAVLTAVVAATSDGGAGPDPSDPWDGASTVVITAPASAAATTPDSPGTSDTPAAEPLASTPMQGHAVLAPSAANRWLRCTRSARFELEHGMDTESAYAAEGVLAHELAAAVLAHRIGGDTGEKTQADVARLARSDLYTPELQRHVDVYVDWVAGLAGNADTCSIELSVRMDKWVPGGFGTADVILVSERELHVIDFKFGRVAVPAANNPQLRLYALGALQHTAGRRWPVDTSVKLSIYQPRVLYGEANDEPWTTDTLSLRELLRWADEFVVPAAELAASGTGDFVPGPHCQYCSARAICRARGAALAEAWDGGSEVVGDETQGKLKPVDTLTDAQIATVLRLGPSIKKWVDDVAAHARAEAVAGRRDFTAHGISVVPGRPRRVYSNPAAVASALAHAGYSDEVIWRRSVQTIGVLEKSLGKDVFATLLEDTGLVVKPVGEKRLAVRNKSAIK